MGRAGLGPREGVNRMAKLIKVSKNCYVDINDACKWSSAEIYEIIEEKRSMTKIYFTVQFIADADKLRRELPWDVQDEMTLCAICDIYQRLIEASAPTIGLVWSQRGKVTSPEQVARVVNVRNLDLVQQALDVLIDNGYIRILDSGEYFLNYVPKMVLGRNHTDSEGRQKTWGEMEKSVVESERVRKYQKKKVASDDTAKRVKAVACDDLDAELPFPAGGDL